MESSDLCWILGGYDPEDWERQKQLKSRQPHRMATCFGLHPWFVSKSRFEEVTGAWDRLQEVVAQADFVGEIGLDFSKAHNSSREKQLQMFRKQWAMAQEFEKPIVLHTVQALRETFVVLDEGAQKNFGAKGFVHAFTGSPEVGNEFTRRGFLLSIGPQLLNQNLKKLRKTVQTMGLQHLLLESDSPHDKSEVDYKGSDILQEIAEEVALLRGISVEVVQTQVQGNLSQLPFKGFV